MKALRSLRRRRMGQIVIPALFIFPTLFLFVYLIFETAKLSREKIRHQFAIDAAVFVEMTNYSDFLNRTAYVNGAFPMRIFEEGFKSTMIDCDQKKGCNGRPRSLWDILYDNGTFPRSLSGRSQYSGDDRVWDIGYGGSVGNGKNSATPTLPGTLMLISMDDANSWWINWDDANQIYKLYVQIYQLLGSVEDAQYSVLKRLTAQHNFLKKSYWLNTGDPIAEAVDMAQSFDATMGSWSSSQIVQPYCHQKIYFHGNKPTGSAFQPWEVWGSEPPPTLPNTIDGCQGLFQIMWVNPTTIKKLRNPNAGNPYPGIPVTQQWTAPGNYFDVNFNNMMEQGRPQVHATVAVGVGSNASVWPFPTPKFQVRTYP